MGYPMHGRIAFLIPLTHGDDMGYWYLGLGEGRWPLLGLVSAKRRAWMYMSEGLFSTFYILLLKLIMDSGTRFLSLSISLSFNVFNILSIL